MKIFWVCKQSIFLTLILILNGCSGFRIIQGGNIIKGMYNCYSNDSLKINIQVFGGDKIKSDNLSSLQKKIAEKLFELNHVRVLFTIYNGDAIHCNHEGIFGLYMGKFNGLKRNYTYRKIDQNQGYYFKHTNFGEFSVYDAVVPRKEYNMLFIFYSKSNIDTCMLADADFYVENISSGTKYKKCDVENPFTIAYRAFSSEPKGNYLLPVMQLKYYRENYKTEIEKNLFYQAMANYYALMDETDSALLYWNAAFNPSGPIQKDIDKIKFLINTGVNTDSLILQQAKNNQVIFFNENHSEPKDRYFIGMLLKELHQSGFNYLGFEALVEDDSVNSRGYPSMKSGFYSCEPVMANLIRYAKSLGMNVVAYEPDSGDRELGEAENLYAKTIGKYPEAKVIVLAGFNHVNEKESNGFKSMAIYFKEISHIDPLTINQTQLDIYSPFVQNNKVFIIKGEDYLSNFLGASMSNDDYIINNLDIRESPIDFGDSLYYSFNLAIPSDVYMDQSPVILFLYKKSELNRSNPVPVFIRVLRNEKSINLKLSDGIFQVMIRDYNNEILFEKEIDIK